MPRIYFCKNHCFHGVFEKCVIHHENHCFCKVFDCYTIDDKKVRSSFPKGAKREVANLQNIISSSIDPEFCNFATSLFALFKKIINH